MGKVIYRIGLEVVETRTFGCGVVYLRYEVSGTPPRR
jgi:hypothetical protein